jgi:hypothetical protein
MNTTIELSAQLHQRLEQHAFGFNQTPLSVIENALNSLEKYKADIEAERKEFVSPTKYLFNNEILDKSRLVLKVVTDYVNKQEEPINLYQLSQSFPNELQGEIGLANKFYDVAKKYDGLSNKHHFVSEQDLLDLQDGQVAISSEWGVSNIQAFIKRARELDYCIEIVDKDISLGESHVASQNTKPYVFKNEALDESHLVLRVISDYVNAQEEDINLYQLSQAFPSEIQGEAGIAHKLYDVLSEYDGHKDKRHFIGELEMLDLQDGKVAISTQWHSGNIDGFIERARELGYNINSHIVGERSIIEEGETDDGAISDDAIYVLDGQKFDASHLVKAVILDYVNKQEEDINLYQLTQAFPNDLQGSVGIAKKYDEVLAEYDGQDEKHHFVSEDELLDLQDGKVAIAKQWDESNVISFIQHARELGYNIESDGSLHSIGVSGGKSKARIKYIYNEEKLAPSALVLSVITDYVNQQEEDINLYELGQAFPNDLQGSIGIANKYDDVISKHEGEVNKRHFVKEQYLLDLQDGKVAVSTVWDETNIEAFVERAREQGFIISKDGVDESFAA